MGKIYCPGCGAALDRVILGFGSRTWDEFSQSYKHIEGEAEGDWQCPYCGAPVSETEPYPPTGGEARGYYWEITNMVTGEIMQYDTIYLTKVTAVGAAKDIVEDTFPGFAGHHLIIKIFDKSPAEREGITYTPLYTESFWIEEKKLPYHKGTTRPFPETYGDWVALAEDIKDRLSDPAQILVVNDAINDIAQQTDRSEAAKRYLVELAANLGVS